MVDHLTENKRLVKALGATIAYTDIRNGYTGKISAADTINPDPTEGLEQGFVWVRFHENGEAIKARCHKVSARMPDMPVRVGRDVTTKEWVVLEVVPMDVGSINDLASTFSVPDRNDDYIYERFDANRFRSLHVIPGEDAFDVEVEPGYYWYHGELKAFSGGTVNVATSVPSGTIYSGKKRGVLIGIDPTDNSLTTFDGEEVGILVTPGNKGKYFTETYIADTVNDADSAIYWIALIPLTSNDVDWRDLYRVTALQLAGSLGVALSGHGIRVNGTDQTQRGFINFLSGNGIVIAGVDDSANDETEITFTVDESELSLAFVDLTDTPASYTSQALKGLRVNAGATGVEFHNFDDDYVNVTGDSMTGTLGVGVSDSIFAVFASNTFQGAANSALFFTGTTTDVVIDQNTFNFTNAVGARGVSGAATITGASGTVTGAAGIYGIVNKQGAGTLTTGASLYAATITKTDGILTNAVGLYVESQTVGTNNHAIYTNSGLNRLGDQLTVVGSANRVQSIVRANGTQTSNLQEWQSSASAVLASIGATGNLTISPSATTGSPGASITLTTPAHTSLSAAEYTDIDFNIANTKQFTTGSTIATLRAVRIRRPTYSATSATQTVTDAVTFEIENAPTTTGGNVALTNTFAFRVAGGISRFNDAVQINGSNSGRNHLVVTAASGQFLDIVNVKNFGGSNLFRLNSKGAPQISPEAATGSPENSILLTAPAHTALSAGVEIADVQFNFNRTVQWSTGALTNQRFFYIRRPTIAFVGASTVTNTATVYIENAPAAGTNATLTNSYALWIDDGTFRLDGTLNHQGGSAGLFGVTPTTRSTGWSVTNPATRKTFDTTTVTLSQLAEVVGTLIDYLKLLGPLGA